MKKILLIPTTLIAAITPIIATTSCKDPEDITKYHFEFTGNHCKINGHDKLSVDIEENTKVEYTVLPDDGYILSATQDLPSGVTLIGNLLTIAKMDKAYTVTINTEETSSSQLVIEGLNEDYVGTVGYPGNTNKITVNLVEQEKTTDVTDLVIFNLPEGLTWNRTQKWFEWSGTFNQGEYDFPISANYLGTLTSETYTTMLVIAADNEKLVCQGLATGDMVIVPPQPGEIPVNFLYYDGYHVQPTNVTTNVVMNPFTTHDFFKWDALNKKFYWTNISFGGYNFNLDMEYKSEEPYIDVVCNLCFKIMCQY